MSAAAPRGFAGLGLIDELSAALSALGYEEATPVQREAIPLLILFELSIWVSAFFERRWQRAGVLWTATE